MANGGVISDGLLIQNGSLKSLDAAVTGSFTTAKLKFTAKSIRLNYQSDVGNTRCELSGGASMEFNVGSVKSVADVLFGVNGGPGIVFANGTFPTMTLEVSGSLMAAALTFDANKLVINYDATKGTFSARGGVNFTTRGTKINLKLGSTHADGVQTDGLLIEDGTLKTLDAAITGGFEFSKVKFSTKDLRYQYSNVGGNTRFELTGTAALEFTVGGRKLNVSVTFGIAGNPGLVIKNGSFRYMTVQVNGSLNLIGLSITARKLTIKYDANQSEFIMYGEIGVSTAAKGGKKVLDNVTVKTSQTTVAAKTF